MTKVSQHKLPLIWVSNLEKSSNRKQFMTEQFHTFGVNYEFIPATDGQNLTKKELSLYSPFRAMMAEGRLLSRNEIGCALTHAKMYHRIVDEDHDAILILEDDVILNEDLFSILCLQHAFPENWELINFYSDTPKRPLDRPSIYGKYKLCEFIGDVNRAAACLINQKGAKKLLKSVFPIRYPADGILGRNYETGLVTYGIVPQPVALRKISSDIWENNPASWEKPYWRFTMRWVKKIKRTLHKLAHKGNE